MPVCLLIYLSKPVCIYLPFLFSIQIHTYLPTLDSSYLSVSVSVSVSLSLSFYIYIYIYITLFVTEQLFIYF